MTRTARLQQAGRIPIVLVFVLANETQAQEAHAGEALVLEEVLVTGTRIQRANQVSFSPITQIDASDILVSGLTRVEDLLKNLPQVYSEQNSSTNLNATGTATIDLRASGVTWPVSGVISAPMSPIVISMRSCSPTGYTAPVP